MSKAEKFIQENTKTLKESNDKEYFKWLTPEQAKEAVEIAREEIYEWLEENAAKSLIHYLRQAMKDE